MARKLQGRVVGDSNDKTIIVQVDRQRRHQLYRKNYRVSKKYMVHDPTNSAQVGQQVTIEESRPYSARKRWLLVSVNQPPKTTKKSS